MPTCPLRSASPMVSMRPVSVTNPAPMMTPMIANRDRVGSSEGIAAAVARANSTGVSGRVVIAVAAMMLRLSFRVDGGNYRKTRPQLGSQAHIIERNLDWNSLYYLGEVAGSVVGRQQTEL